MENGWKSNRRHYTKSAYILGMNTSEPMIAAAIAVSNTAPAAKSFERLMASSYSGETRSHKVSIDELNASPAHTEPIANTTSIHSVRFNSNSHPAATTQTVAKQ